MTTIGTTSHISISTGITGSGTSVVPDTSGTILYIKALESSLEFDDNSKVTYSAGGKSRQTPDIKYKQSAKIDGQVLTDNINDCRTMISDSKKNKTRLYLILEAQKLDATYYKINWINSSQATVYYLKGIVKNYSLKTGKNGFWKINIRFDECWT